MFRKIDAREFLYKNMNERFEKFFDDYKNYVQITSNRDGKAKKRSGKAPSYKNFLIKVFILYEEITGLVIKDPYSMETFSKIDKLRSLKEYENYNILEGKFPNSAIRAYLSFLIEIRMEMENEIDFKVDYLLLNGASQNDNDLFVNCNVENLIGPILRKEKVYYNSSFIYPRDVKQALMAKERANWTCEINSKHTTFITASNKKPYVEAHHLLPMASQDLFEYSIDFAENIICLCPNCHRKIHYAQNTEKENMIYGLFEKNNVNYRNYGIDITYEKLLNFYYC